MQGIRSVTLAILALILVTGCSDRGKLRTTQVKAVVGAEVNLGRPFIGDRAQATFPIAAFGEGVFRVKRITTTHPQLSLDWGEHVGGVSVARGSTLNVKVAWSPTDVGVIDTTIEVELDLEGEPVHTVHVTGEARALPSCDDGNQCTDDAFDRGTESCVHNDREGACNDGNACTDDDQCQAGVCRGVAKSCDDDNVCTLNLCDPTSGCVFPPDNRQCDDQDPCTTDVCDPDDGCSHPDAEAGTACGAFSCSTAHVCVFGSCRELDVTGSSDGFPCTDGNACTDGDMCLAGRCQSGPMRPNTGPEIVATLDTYGGEDSFVATDGYRYVFVDMTTTAAPTSDPNALRVTVFDGQALVPHGSLPLVATGSPVMVAPGYFAMPDFDKIVLVNATDPDHPTIAWENTPATTGDVIVRGLAMTRYGLLALISGRATPASPYRSYVLLMPLPNPSTAGQWQTVYDSATIDDFDADDDVLVVSSADGVWWLRLAGTSGAVSEREHLVASATSVRLSVQDRMVVLLYSDHFELVRADMGAKHYASVSTDQVRDIAFVGTTIFTASSNPGIRAYTQDELVNAPTGPHDGTVVAPQSGANREGSVGLARAKDHLIVFGSMALPLRLSGGSATSIPTVMRVTGVGHGSMTRAVEGAGTKVFLGSNTALAEVDVNTRAFSSWSLLPHSPGPGEVYALKGAHRSVPVDPHVRPPDGALTICDGPTWSRFDASGNSEPFKICGLAGGTVAFTADHVWGTPVVSRPDPAGFQDVHGLRAWSTDPSQTQPIIDLPDGSFEHSVGVRSSHDQEYVGWAVNVASPIPEARRFTRLRLFRSDATMSTPVGEFANEEDEPTFIVDVEAYAVTSDAALSGYGGVLRLRPLTPPSATGLPPTVPHGTLATVTLQESQPLNRLLWMADSRAWVGWTGRNIFDGEPINQLSQLRYDVAKNSLEDLGAVTVPATVTSACQSGDYAVATTPKEVVIVAPSCR